MSMRAWESLSPEDRKIFRDAARESSRYMRQKWQALERESEEEARAAGTQVISKFDRKPFEAAMKSVYASASRDPTIKRLIERIQQVQ